MRAEKGNFSIKRMARLLNVSTSGYYTWCERQAQGPSPRAAAQRERDEKIAEVFTDSYWTYDAPRVAAQLGREGVSVDRKTVAASMLRQGIEGISPRRFTPVTTIQGVDTYHLPDRVHRQWDQGALDMNRTGFNRGKEIGKGTLLSCRSNTPTNSRPAPLT